MLKRCVDIVLSVLLLILALPILAIAAIAIEFDSEGPVFFVQPRMGRGFNRFVLFKLRTMRVNCEGTDYARCRSAHYACRALAALVED